MSDTTIKPVTPDNYMELRRNSAIAQRTRLQIIRKLLYDMYYPSFMCFIPSKNREEIKLLDDIETDLQSAMDYLKVADEKVATLLRYYDDSSGNKSSEVCK